jgi:hypothetical protein
MGSDSGVYMSGRRGPTRMRQFGDQIKTAVEAGMATRLILSNP